MLVDMHVHFGQWADGRYFEPLVVCEYVLEKQNVDIIGVSSTSACREKYCLADIVEEVAKVMGRWPHQVFHWLWLHPQNVPTLAELKELSVPIHGFKIHPFNHNWHTDPETIAPALELARALGFPILMHTGGNEHADAGHHRKVLNDYKDVTVVLAHARPVEQAIEIAMECPNVWMDTSFLPLKDYGILVENGLENRLLTGSDYPIFGEIYPGNYNKDYIHLYSERMHKQTKIFLERFCKSLAHGVN